MFIGGRTSGPAGISENTQATIIIIQQSYSLSFSLMTTVADILSNAME